MAKSRFTPGRGGSIYGGDGYAYNGDTATAIRGTDKLIDRAAEHWGITGEDVEDGGKGTGKADKHGKTDRRVAKTHMRHNRPSPNGSAASRDELERESED